MAGESALDRLFAIVEIADGAEFALCELTDGHQLVMLADVVVGGVVGGGDHRAAVAAGGRTAR